MSRPNEPATKLAALTIEQDLHEKALSAKYRLIRQITSKMVAMGEAKGQLEKELNTLKQCINSCTQARIHILLEDVETNG